jgi:hypothetical protein
MEKDLQKSGEGGKKDVKNEGRSDHVIENKREIILIEADPIISVKIDSLFCNSHYVFETKWA